MNLHRLSRKEFLDLAHHNADELLSKIAAPDVLVVKEFYPPEEILELRRRVFESGLKGEPSWHPLYDNCPDYHRLHDNYAGAYVKSKMHAFYFHAWYKHNERLFHSFDDIFVLKNKLGGYPNRAFLDNLPSQGFVARLTVHHYPRGGGGQCEHIDPAGPYARIQTLVQASTWGIDYQEGGLYARKDLDSEKFFIDSYTQPGDLIVLSPDIPHGVAPVDPAAPYDWKTNHGRWIIIPLIVASDYPNPDAVKPRQITA
ncbi:MAG TPA: hypothetical protein V6D08_16790 [Candidatus Obscuribacterales bacterium]